MSVVVQGNVIAEREYDNGTVVKVTDEGQKIVYPHDGEAVIVQGPGRAVDGVPIIETPPPSLQPNSEAGPPAPAYMASEQESADQGGAPFLAKPITDPAKAVAEAAAIPALSSSVDLDEVEARVEARIQAALDQQRAEFQEWLEAREAQEAAAAEVTDGNPDPEAVRAEVPPADEGDTKKGPKTKS